MSNFLINTTTKIVKSKIFKRAILKALIKVIFVDVWVFIKDSLTDFL